MWSNLWLEVHLFTSSRVMPNSLIESGFMFTVFVCRIFALRTCMSVFRGFRSFYSMFLLLLMVVNFIFAINIGETCEGVDIDT